jgi:uncharacterized peroxidase-related enzyme
MPWIETIPYEAATGSLREAYDRVKGPGERVDNIILAQSLRPHAIAGHFAIYRAALHDPALASPRWFLQAVGVLVSLLNGCAYCAEHHTVSMGRFLGDPARTAALRSALEAGTYEEGFEPAEAAALRYAAKLTRQPWTVTAADIEAIRSVGMDDARILEVNQVAAYFAYANRTVLGLGVDLHGDSLGSGPDGGVVEA